MSLIEYLRWTSADGEPYDGTFLRRAEARMADAIIMVGDNDPAGVDVYEQIIRDLPFHSIQRLMMAPELEYRVRDARADAATDSARTALGAFMASSMGAELAAGSVHAREVDSEVWFANGEPAHTARGSNRSSRAASTATVLGQRIPVDFCSPYNRGDLPNRFPSHANHESDERDHIIEKIARAFRIIEDSGTEIGTFVASFTTVVVPLRIATNGAWFGSFSSSWYPGRTVIVNAHAPEMSTYDLAAALIHEAIHSLVDVSELAGRMLAAEASPQHNVRSPWTGNVISLQSLVDAYFVWYGLLHFWRALAARRPDLSNVCEHYEAICRLGFHSPLHDVVGREALAAVHSFAKDHIEGLRLRVNDSGASHQPS